MKLINRFIVWYLKRHNVRVEHNGYVVRMYTKEYYEGTILEAEQIHRFIISNVEKTKNASYENNENFLTVKTERDTYLGLYNKLLERVLNSGMQKGEV